MSHDTSLFPGGTMAPSSSSVFGGPASLRPRHEDQEVFQQHKNQCPPDQHRTKSKDVSTAPVDRTAARQLPSDSATFGASAATVVGRCWTEVYGFNDSGLPTAHVAFTLDLHIPGQMLRKCTIIVRWSAVRALHVTLAPCWPRRWAAGYTKAMAKLAPGPSFAFASGSCMDQEVALKRLASIAAYLQAVLEESRLHKNADVQAFLDQGRVQAQACRAKASHDMVTWATVMNPTGQVHIAATPAATPDASTASSSNAFEALPRSASELALAPTTPTEEPLPPLPQQQVASPTPPPPPTLEENVSKAMQLLLFDAQLLLPLLRPSDLCSLSQTRTEWRVVVDGVSAVALRPNLKISQPAPDHLTLDCKTIQTIRREKAAGIPCTLTQAAHDVRQDAAWHPFFLAFEQDKVQCLQQLDLSVMASERASHLQLTWSPMERLAALFPHMPNLLHLDLEGNEIGVRGAVALADALQHTPRLQYLNLSGNDIGDRGVQAVADALQRGCCPELECLDLTGCDITAAGARALSLSFTGTPMLKYLGFTPLKRGDATPIVLELPTLQQLRCLVISGPMMECEVEKLAEQLLRLPSLRLLELKYSAVSLKGFLAVMVTTTKLKLVSIVDYCDFLAPNQCRFLTGWLKVGAFKNKQYTMLTPPKTKSGVGRRSERALEFSHSDMGFAFVKPEWFWPKGTLKERFGNFKDCWDKDIITPNEYANMW